MATGSSSDFLNRLWRLIPSGWFNNAAYPIATAILGGISDSLANIYALLTYAIAQCRISSAYSFWLDLIAWDFLGPTFVRSAGQNDASFQAAVKAQIVQPRVTRAGVVSVIKNLTGNTPEIFEPWNTGDAGGWDSGYGAWDTDGGWGDTCLPAQVFIIAYRSGWQGVPNISGWDGSGADTWASGGWDKGSIEWIDSTLTAGTVTDAQIYAAIAQSVAEGVTAWVQLSNLPTAADSSEFVPLLGSGAV